MFVKNLVPQSLVDAVSKIIADDTKEMKTEKTPETLSEASFEDRLEKAREKAAAAGKTMKSPQKPDSNVRKVAGHSYGGSAQKPEMDDDEEKPAKKSKKMKEDSYPSFKQKLIERMKQKELEKSIDGREMSSSEMKKREDIVMSMKDKSDYFKKKYGKHWKDVMYKTATKQAMKEDAESIDEGHSMHSHTVHFADPKSGEWKGKMLVNADNDKDAIECGQDMAKKHGMKLMKVSKNNVIMSDKTTMEELEIFNSQIEEIQEAEHPDEVEDKKLIKKMVDKSCLKKEESEIEEAKVDQGLSGADKVAARAARANKEPILNIGNTTGGQWRGKSPSPYRDTYVAKSGERKGMITKSAIQRTKDQIRSRLNKEESEIEEAAHPQMKTTDMLRGRVKGGKDNEHKSYKITLKSEDKRPEQDNVPFTGPYNTTSSPSHDTKDKSGAVHTPMSRAKHLAKMAMQRVKKETLGKAPGNN